MLLQALALLVHELGHAPLIDTKKTHTHAVCDDASLHIELPPQNSEEGKCAKLMRWLYWVAWRRTWIGEEWQSNSRMLDMISEVQRRQ